MTPDFLDEILHYNIRPANPDADKCALFVIDMQEYFRPLAAPILENVGSVIAACRTGGMSIICSRHGHKDPAADGGMLAKWWGDLIHYGSAEWEILSQLPLADTDVIVDKNRYSVFQGTGIDELLRSRNVDQLIITGVMTNCCCETTARDAFVRDYRVFFVSDATATVNHELHTASLKNLAYGFAHIVSTRQLCAHLGQQNG